MPLPCPFCGCGPAMPEVRFCDKPKRIRLRCVCNVKTAWYETLEEAVEVWNTRPFLRAGRNRQTLRR